jgi:ABC-type antimicrobial peptide transport system permease subunit
MGARLADNLELVDFKQTAVRTFKDVGTFFNVQVFSMTIYDSVFYEITEALMQTIFFIDIATPFIYFIAVCVGFIASFLLTRRRKGEFAMMRSVGVSKAGIFMGALFEQTMLCAVGVALGCFLFTLTWDYVFIERPLIFLGCYMLGAAVSAARAAGTDVLRLLRDKE